MTNGRPQVSRRDQAPSGRDPDTFNPRREVAAIAARIAGGMAVVLTFTGSLGYLIVRVLTS
jgi:hypothetical protein